MPARNLDPLYANTNTLAKGVIMQMTTKWSALLLSSVFLLALQLAGTPAQAQSSYFTSRGCVNCHSTPVVATCNGCHHHGDVSLKAATNKTSYAPGETVTVTLTSSSTRSGWIRAILYDQTGTQVAVSNGNASGMGGSTTYPAALTAPAPAIPGTYVWKMAYFGNNDGTGTRDVHSETAVNANSFTVVAPADTIAPVVSSFTLPATATFLSIPVSSFVATDNVSVTGYQITSSAIAPTVWSATPPTSVTAATEGSVAFYAWAKDAAGNISLSKSASVVITLPDTTAPVVSAFTLPATSTSLKIPVSSLVATDNVGVTDYRITISAVVPVAGWSATKPISVTAPKAGLVNFYAWARDAAGNVSLSKRASVTVSDIAAPVVSAFTLPATATSGTIPVTSFTVTDNFRVTGYRITTSAIAPTTGWSTTKPVSVTALTTGSITFYAWAKDAVGNVSLSKSASVTIPVTADILNPALAVSTLASGAITNNGTLNVSGRASDAGGLKSVTVNGQIVTVKADGSFSVALTLFTGSNPVNVVALDKAGNQTAIRRNMTYDPAAPLLTVETPADNSMTALSFVSVSGQVIDASTVTVKVNNAAPQYAALNGTVFSAVAYLVPGLNTLAITTVDPLGNISNAKRTITYNSAKPTLAVSVPDQDLTTSLAVLNLQGAVADTLSSVTATIVMDGTTYSPAIINGVFQQQLTFTTAKQYAIAVSITDAAGKKTTVTRNVIYQPAP